MRDGERLPIKIMNQTFGQFTITIAIKELKKFIRLYHCRHSKKPK